MSALGFGNVDVSKRGNVIELRMAHVVRGHPGCLLTTNEVVVFASYLLSLVGATKVIETKAADEPKFIEGKVTASADDFEDLLG